MNVDSDQLMLAIIEDNVERFGIGMQVRDTAFGRFVDFSHSVGGYVHANEIGHFEVRDAYWFLNGWAHAVGVELETEQALKRA